MDGSAASLPASAMGLRGMVSLTRPTLPAPLFRSSSDVKSRWLLPSCCADCGLLRSGGAAGARAAGGALWVAGGREGGLGPAAGQERGRAGQKRRASIPDPGPRPGQTKPSQTLVSQPLPPKPPLT